MQEIIHESLAGYWQLCFRTATTSGPAHKPARGGNVEARRKRQTGWLLVVGLLAPLKQQQ